MGAIVGKQIPRVTKSIEMETHTRLRNQRFANSHLQIVEQINQTDYDATSLMITLKKSELATERFESMGSILE